MGSPVFPRETVEFLPVVVRVDGTVVTADVEFSVVAAGARPVTFAAPTTIGAAIGVMVDTLDPGTYTVWAQVTSTPEVPVIDCGSFRVN